MARFARTQVQWKLRRPTVVGASITFRPLKVALTDRNRPAYFVLQRGVHSRLRPPTKLAPSIVFAPVRVLLTDPERPAQLVLQRGAHSRLRPPTVMGVVAVPTVAPPLKLSLAKTNQQPYAAHYKLRPPAVVAPSIVFAPVRVQLHQPSRQPFAPHTKLFPPAAVGPSTVFPPVKVTLRQPPRQGYATHSKLRPPVVVGASVVFAAIRTRLARTPRAYQLAKSQLRPPTTLIALVFNFVAPPKLGKLARTPQAYLRTIWKLRPPTVVAPSVVFPPIKTRLAPQPAQARVVKSHLFALPPAPTFVLTADQVQLLVKLAVPPKPPRTSSKLRKPAVIGPLPVLFDQQRLNATLTFQPKQARAPHSILRDPTVIDPALVGAIYTLQFGQPNPDGNDFDAGPTANSFRGSLGEGELVGVPAGNAFRPPGPRHG